MKVAVIGCGRWGMNHVRVLREMGVLHVVCDPNPQAIKKVNEQFPDVSTTTDVERVMNDPDIPACVIASSAIAHAPIAFRTLKAGKDVLVEKPLALKVSDAEELVTFADEKKRILMVGHMLHYHPAIEAMLEKIADGALGKVLKIFSVRANWGSFRVDENILWSFAPHDISLHRRFAAQDPERVWSYGEDYDFTTPGVHDTSLSLLKFPNGILGEIKVSWINLNKEHRIVITGSEGMLVFTDSDKTDKLKLHRRRIKWQEGRIPIADQNPEITVIPYDTTAEPLRCELEHFLECIESRNRPLTDGREGLAVLRILDASQRSLEQGGVWVSVQSHRYWAHKTAEVHPDAVVGAGTKIWQHSQVLKGAIIGEGCVLGHNCTVFGGATLGNGVKLESNIDVWPMVTIEDDVFVGPSAVFTNDMTPRAAEPKGGKWMATKVCRGASIGANATILPGVTIGEHAMIGAGAVVNKDVPAHGLVVGVPARRVGWVCKCNQMGHLDFSDTLETTCEFCGRRYRKEGGAGLYFVVDVPQEAVPS